MRLSRRPIHYHRCRPSTPHRQLQQSSRGKVAAASDRIGRHQYQDTVRDSSSDSTTAVAVAVAVVARWARLHRACRATRVGLRCMKRRRTGKKRCTQLPAFLSPNFIMNIQPLARTGCCCGQTTNDRVKESRHKLSFFAQQGGGGDRFDPTAGIGGYGSTMAPGMLAAAGAAAAGGRPVAGGGTGGATGVAAGTSAAMQVR